MSGCLGEAFVREVGVDLCLGVVDVVVDVACGVGSRGLVRVVLPLAVDDELVVVDAFGQFLVTR